MSRIGKQPIVIPEKVEVSQTPEDISIKGPKGALSFILPRGIGVTLTDSNNIVVVLKDAKRGGEAMWGTTRALIYNMIEGVTKGFEKSLVVEGIGYRAQLKGKDLELLLGFSHPVAVKAPEGIDFSVEKNIIKVSGISKELVGNTAASIRALKKPEPYKGKGIHYEGEVIRRKAGKKAVASAS